MKYVGIIRILLNWNFKVFFFICMGGLIDYNFILCFDIWVLLLGEWLCKKMRLVGKVV